MARIYPTGGIDSEVESVEAAISDGDEAVPFGPRDVELVSSQFRASEEEVPLREEAQKTARANSGISPPLGKCSGVMTRCSRSNLRTRPTSRTGRRGGSRCYPGQSIGTARLNRPKCY